MRKKYWIFFVIIMCLFLTGCSDLITYNLDLFKPNKETCWPCQMYTSAFLAVSTALERSLEIICSNTMKVMTLGLAFWLMYKVFPWVVSFSPPNFKEDFVQLIKVLFKAMIISLFLTNPHYFYDIIGKMVLQPLATVFLKVSELVLVSPNALGVETTQYARGENTFLSGLTDWYNSFRNSGVGRTAADLFSGASDILSRVESLITSTRTPNGQTLSIPTTDRMFGTLPTQINSVIWQIYSALWSGMALVFQLLSTGYVAAWIAAIALGFGLFQLLIYLPLSFIDAFMRLGIGVILMPIFMAIWIFPIKIVEGMGKKLIDLIFSAFFDILFNCIYVAFLLSILNVYVKSKLPPVFSTDYQASEARMREAGENLTMEFLIMFVLVYTVLKLFDRVDEITGTFFGGAGQGTSIKAAIRRSISLAVTTGIAIGRTVASGGTDWGGFKNVAKEAGDLAKAGVDDMNSSQEKDYWKNGANE